MEQSRVIFLASDQVKGVLAIYELGPTAPEILFKTLIPDLHEGDYVVVDTNETQVRHKLAVCRVVAVDVDVDLDDKTPVHWIVDRIRCAAFDVVRDHEKVAISRVRSAELQRRRNELKATTMKGVNLDDLGPLLLETSDVVSTPSPRPAGEWRVDDDPDDGPF